MAAAPFKIAPYAKDAGPGRGEGSALASLLESSSLRVASAINYRCSESWSLPSRRLGDSYWSMILAGEGKASLELAGGARSFAVAKGALLLFPEGVRHELRPLKGSRMAMVNVHFHLKAWGSLEPLGLCGAAGLFRDDGSLARKGLFREGSLAMAREFGRREPGWGKALEAQAWTLLLPLLRPLAGSAALEAAGGGAKLEAFLRLRPVFELIERRKSDPSLSVGELAASINVSEVYLRRLFLRAVGAPPAAFVQRLRFLMASKLLKEEGLSIKEAAAASGFRELPFFYRVFRKLAGCPPGEFRKAAPF